ncbi:terminase small subunit [Ligilactobacillus hayakitensis]|uniref:terminase small subunit n=1 Tax=Ligilactobacillus hayakitensis TaxID=396716 RepID=UPI001CDB398D
MTNKQQAFINYYLGESKMNATDTARCAGYKHPNKQGPENLVLKLLNEWNK